MLAAAAVVRQQASFQDPDAAALIALMTGSPDTTRQNLIEALIVGLKADGIWTKLDRLGLTGLNEHDSLLDWKRIADFSNINGCAFVADRGFTGAAGKYIDTNFVPATDGINYTQNDASFGVYLRLNIAEVSAVMGAQSAGTLHYSAIHARYSDDKLYGRVNDTTSAWASALLTDSRGLSVARRVAATGQNEVWRNGVSQAVAGGAATGLANVSMYVLTYNGAGHTASANQAAGWFMGGSLTPTQQANLYSRIQTYMTGIGANV